MSVLTAIHQHWATYRPLADRVAPDHFFTATVPAGDASGHALAPPYATVQQQETRDSMRASGGLELQSIVLRFRVFSTSLDEAKQIVMLIHQRFQNATRQCGNLLIQDMRRVAQHDTPLNNGHWLSEADYLTRIEERR